MAVVAEPATYVFSVYSFSGKEIDQIVSLVREWSSGRILPLDQRRYTRQVLEYAYCWRLLDKRDDGRLVCGTSRFSVCYDLPIEALWRLVEPMLHGQRSIGRSIASHTFWLNLNIYPQGHSHATDATLQEQIDVLNILARHGYLLVQMAGSIWEIARWRN